MTAICVAPPTRVIHKGRTIAAEPGELERCIAPALAQEICRASLDAGPGCAATERAVRAAIRRAVSDPATTTKLQQTVHVAIPRLIRHVELALRDGGYSEFAVDMMLENDRDHGRTIKMMLHSVLGVPPLE